MAPQKITEYPDMAIVMSDGTRLSARVWMPENAPTVPVPAILEFLPYRKRDGTCEQIGAAASVDVGGKPVEQCLSQAVTGGAKAGQVGK